MSTQVEWAFDETDRRRRVHKGCGGSVTLQNGRPVCGRCAAVDDNGGWIKRLLMWNWHWTSLDGWPGWDVVNAGDAKHPPYVELRIVKDTGKSSQMIASEWDDVATGLFYSRDFTDDGLPYVRAGDTYRAGFWFQKTADRDAFIQRYGGTAHG
jgi:hypothetical protein